MGEERDKKKYQTRAKQQHKESTDVIKGSLDWTQTFLFLLFSECWFMFRHV